MITFAGIYAEAVRCFDRHHCPACGAGVINVKSMISEPAWLEYACGTKIGVANNKIVATVNTCF